MKTILLCLGCYLAVLSLVGILYCIYDKLVAKKAPRRRVPEKSLFAVAAFGGAAAMLFCMLLIRHKTKHKRFMIGLPLIILGHILLLAGGLYLCLRYNLMPL